MTVATPKKSTSTVPIMDVEPRPIHGTPIAGRSDVRRARPVPSLAQSLADCWAVKSGAAVITTNAAQLERSSVPAVARSLDGQSNETAADNARLRPRLELPVCAY